MSLEVENVLTLAEVIEICNRIEELSEERPDLLQLFVSAILGNLDEMNSDGIREELRQKLIAKDWPALKQMLEQIVKRTESNKELSSEESKKVEETLKLPSKGMSTRRWSDLEKQLKSLL